jgi:peptide/nickel transport system permease protein
MTATVSELDVEPRRIAWSRSLAFCRRHPTMAAGAVVLIVMVVLAIMAPFFTGDPLEVDPINRLRPPSADTPFGTDNIGRDVFARTVSGARMSLLIGVSVALLATVAGLFIGIVSGFFRTVDAVLMRVMDGLMAIPEILLAIALMAVTRASVQNVIIAIAVSATPRMARLVRSIVLSLREQPYVEAAVSIGTPTWKILWRHILPNTMSPVLVQATYVFASAMLTEALLSFIGAGTPPEVPSWGNGIASGRVYFQIAPWIIYCPGALLALTVLTVNLMGDGMRDMLDPRLARQMK